MAVVASPEAIRDMKKDIQNTIKDIEAISNVIKSALSVTSNWDDAQSVQFNELMQRIASLTEAPIDTLEQAVPRLENLAQSLDDYNSVRF